MTDPPTTRPMSSSFTNFTESRPPAAAMLSEDEARGFHGAFIMGFIGFTIIAAIAHYAVWQWRPWIPGTAGYEVRTAQSAPAAKAPTTIAYNVPR